jgi:hypothetical protein
METLKKFLNQKNIEEGMDLNQIWGIRRIKNKIIKAKKIFYFIFKEILLTDLYQNLHFNGVLGFWGFGVLLKLNEPLIWA